MKGNEVEEEKGRERSKKEKKRKKTGNEKVRKKRGRGKGDIIMLIYGDYHQEDKENS